MQPDLTQLSRRERQIMDVVYRLGETTAAQVIDGIADPPSANAVRRMLAILEEKGFLRHRWEGRRHVYAPTISRDRAKRMSLRHLRDTFFDGSMAEAMAAMFDESAGELSRDELEALHKMIARARKEGR